MMFSMTKGKMRGTHSSQYEASSQLTFPKPKGVNLILSVIVIFGLLSALLNAAPVPDDDDASMQTFELDNGGGAAAAAAPNFFFSPVAAAVTGVVDAVEVLANHPNSSPRVWKLGTMNDHDHPDHPAPAASSQTHDHDHHHHHPDFESPLGHPYHNDNDTHDSATDQLHQLDRRHSFALNCQDDRSYTNACTRKGYSCNSLGRLITRGRDSWCDSKCRCVNLSPKSCLNQLAVYIDCYLKGENIMGADGTVIGNLYAAEDLGNDTLVLH